MSRRGTARPPQMRAAKKAYEGFHDRPMNEAGRFSREIVVPTQMPYLGPCEFVTYRSDKWNDGTHDYIHKISSYPRVKLAVAQDDENTGKLIAIPKRVREAVTVSEIGLQALGYAATADDGDSLEAKLPRGCKWYWSPTAKALYCIQSKRKLVAVVWGGKLNVEPRGIVG